MNTRRWTRLRPWKRHSLVVIVAGIAHVLIGVSYIFIPGPPIRAEALRVALSIFPIQVWGTLFVLVGLAAILSSRWPPASDTWGYAVMSAMAVLWAMFYLGGMALGSAHSNVTNALIWATLGFLWWAISGLHNPQDLPTREHGSHE